MALDYELVVETATELLKEGRNPSATAVIDRLGRGSKSTALKHLDAWRESLKGKGFALPSDLPKELLPAVTAFWNAATQEAAGQFEADRQKVEEQKQAAIEDARIDREARQSAEDTATRAEEALRIAQERIKQLEGTAAEQRSALAREREALAAEREQHDQVLKELRAEHRSALQELRSERDVAVAERDSRIAELQKALQAADERYDRELVHWIKQLDSQRQATDRAVEQVDKERSARQSERALLERQLEVAKAQAGQAESGLIEAERTVTRLEDEVARVQNAQVDRIEALEARNAELEADRERLSSLLHRLEWRTQSEADEDQDRER